MIFTHVGIVLIGLILLALLTTFEAALISSNPLKIYAQVSNKNKLRRLMHLFQHPTQIINSLILALNILDITLALFVFKTFHLYFNLWYAGLYATIFSVVVTLIFGEIIPKAFAITFPQFFILKFFIIIEILVFCMKPFVLILNLISRKFFLKTSEQSGSPISRSEVELLFYQNRDIHVQQQLVQMIYKVLSIDNVRIKEAKVPISDVLAFSQNMTVGDFKKNIVHDYYSLIPIYDEDIFDIVGYVISQTIFFCEDDSLSIGSFRNKTLFFPENQRIDSVIQQMESEHIPLAFVVDEFGAVAGMVTKKDLTEIILGGSIQTDENHMGKGAFVVASQNGWIVSGRQDIDELNDQFGFQIQKDGFETLSGFMMSRLNVIPSNGDNFLHNGFIFKVKEMQGFFVYKVEIMPVSGS